MRKLLSSLIDAWRALEARLTQVESDETVKRYGEPVRRVRRLEAIGAWRDNALALLRRFRDEELPNLRAAQAQDVTKALEFISRGGVPKKSDPPLPERTSLNRDVVSRMDEMERALVASVTNRLDGLARHLEVSNAFVLNNIHPTETIAGRIDAYLQEARTAPDFDYRAYAIDRLILPAVLRGRAAAGDHRAGMALEAFPQIEKALLDRAAPASFQDSDGEDIAKTEQVVSQAIRGEGEAAQENIGPAREWFGFLARGLERQKQFEDANPGPTMPKPRVEVDQDVLNRIAIGRQAPAPIARLWGQG